MSSGAFGAGHTAQRAPSFPPFDTRPLSRRATSPHPSPELVEHLVARQDLRDAGVGFSALADGGEEFAILQFDAVHTDIDLAHVDLFVLAVEEIIVARDVGRGVADIAEEGAERPLIVERGR